MKELKEIKNALEKELKDTDYEINLTSENLEIETNDGYKESLTHSDVLSIIKEGCLEYNVGFKRGWDELKREGLIFEILFG